ncbi:winged helix-turn-helix transcriptional regulator, partial [Kibdelosporangium lantanae]
MKRTPFGAWPCSIARAVDIVGDWWTPLVLREMFYGLKRFDEFERTLRIGRNILTQRLNRLVAEGLVERVPYQDKPLRHEYVLTEMGRDFFPVLAAMTRWGDRWLAPEGAPVVLHHSCGHV